MGLRKEKLENFRKVLLERREFLAADLEKATEKMIDEEPFFADSVDQAAADTDRGLIVQMKNRERYGLEEIDLALNRIENGTFGICESCSEQISEARMKASPATTLCIDCKAELESEQNRFPGRA